jgi:hypothetical protein
MFRDVLQDPEVPSPPTEGPARACFEDRNAHFDQRSDQVTGSSGRSASVASLAEVGKGTAGPEEPAQLEMSSRNTGGPWGLRFSA